MTTTNTDLVRASREGDQFHYLWAARRCLRLLAPQSDLVAISIEGASPRETAGATTLKTGEELIDVAEYYGSETPSEASLIRYIQLKHSTLRTDEPWTPSEMEDVLWGFAQKFADVQSAADPLSREYHFVSNRPISARLLETVEDVSSRVPIRHPRTLESLVKRTGLSGVRLTDFCSRLRLEGSQDGQWEQRNILNQDLASYLPGFDYDAPTQLKGLVTRKALPENAENPTITRKDVLWALGTDEASLFPARCLIESLSEVVPRGQESEIGQAVLATQARPLIIHAAGGVGKSILATRIPRLLPEGSACVLYDCFGNGEYRSPSRYRHRHKDALVQIANELAGQGLCHPIIPSPRADASAYVKAFLHRLDQSSEFLRAHRAGALLAIVIDAADNAEIASDEAGESRSFARDLLREKMPDGVRLIMLCRTHRRSLLDPPPAVAEIELQPFKLEESALHLRSYFAEANDQDVTEFHSRSSMNPRVQRIALSSSTSLQEVLRKLSPGPVEVEDAIEGLLEEVIRELRDAHGSIERPQIDRICQALAILPPPIPIEVLASLAEVQRSVVESFVLDLGRPLLFSGDTVQFRDEPTETWFREKFGPSQDHLGKVVSGLQRLSNTSTYAAASLPQIMLRAGFWNELVEGVLKSEYLPADESLGLRDVELHRLQFALKASLRLKRYPDATKLAFKAGSKTAGDDRYLAFLQANTDLATKFLAPDQVRDLVARRQVRAAWHGSHYLYEAALLSGQSGLDGDARSHLRMAEEWLAHWLRQSDDERKEERLSEDDIAVFALVHLNLHGAEPCAHFLREWRPRSVSFTAGRIVAQRLVDLNRIDDLNALALAAGNNLYLALAAVIELRRVCRNPPKEVTTRTLRLVASPRVQLDLPSNAYDEQVELVAICALIEAACAYSSITRQTLLTVLERYLPPVVPTSLYYGHWGGKAAPLKLYCLRAVLDQKPLSLIDLGRAEWQEQHSKGVSLEFSQEFQSFKRHVGPLLPWTQLWAQQVARDIEGSELVSLLADAESKSSEAGNRITYPDDVRTSGEIATLRLWILIESGLKDVGSLEALKRWIGSLDRPLYTAALTEMARLAARSTFVSAEAMPFATEAHKLIVSERDHADQQVVAYVDLARAVFPANSAEARAYLDQAARSASKVGDENLERWNSILDLADRASCSNRTEPKLAYEVARGTELTHAYVARDKHFPWYDTATAIAGLCPSSSLAVLSRWQDRDFGRPSRLLPVVVRRLVQDGHLDGRSTLTLVGFRAEWDWPWLLQAALSECSDRSDRETAASLLHRYMSLEVSPEAKAWAEVDRVARSQGIDLPGINERISFGAREASGRDISPASLKPASVTRSLDREETEDRKP